MIIVTGAAGFIGSCLVNKLNNKGFKDVVLVDDFSRPDKMRNLNGKGFTHMVHRDQLFDWLYGNKGQQVDAFFHLGARTDTTETDVDLLNRLNLNYSKEVFSVCTVFKIPLVYASSAATYGTGEFGYSDDHDHIPHLKPLNPYGDSKAEFDRWVLQQHSTPPFWAGMKFFNVFGPNEYHKGRMASVVFHAYRQMVETGSVTLFRSHHPDYAHGEQLRDFIYVKDVVSVLLFMMAKKPSSGIYNLGSGKARTFLDLVNATFQAAHIPPSIRFIDTPEDIRDKYQYFTCASMNKLARAGYDAPFFTLEEAINDYVGTYLIQNAVY